MIYFVNMFVTIHNFFVKIMFFYYDMRTKKSKFKFIQLQESYQFLCSFILLDIFLSFNKDKKIIRKKF